MFVSRWRAAFALGVFGFAATGCSTNPDDSPQFQTADAGVVEDVQQQDTSTVPDTSTPDVTLFDTSAPDTSNPGKLLLYAHNDTSLFSIDPVQATLPLTKIGDFDCLQNGSVTMTDLAVDRDGKLYGVSASAVYLDMKIAGGVVQCAANQVNLPTSTRFYGLTFAPPTAALGNKETLIGADTNGDLYMIDTSTGQPSKVGNFGTVPATDGQGHNYDAANVGKNWELSGDIVFLENGGSPVGFATLRDCPNPPESTDCSRVDTLVEINVQNLTVQSPGIVTKAIRGKIVVPSCPEGTDNCGSTYGIAALNDKVYGFSRAGLVLLINNSTGAGVPVGGNRLQDLDDKGFSGAGVTTLAPVQPPPPK